MTPDDEPAPALKCARCGQAVALGRAEAYLVDIRAVADPTSPVFHDDDFDTDATRQIQRLLKRLRGMSTQQVADQVFRRRLHILCNACYTHWIERPFAPDSPGPATEPAR